MRLIRVVLLLAALLVSQVLLAAEVEAPKLDPWLPAESYEGGRQADARLEKPVHFWQAAITLEEVFAEVARQTGVQVRFFPADDGNRGVRVHLFLNEKQPPALRNLLVQLSWVLDCSFSTAEEEGRRVYYLMGTSIGRGAAEALQARDRQKHQETAEMSRTLIAKLTELGDALKLPREEAIRRYQDDRMLLDLLDEPHRAATQLAVANALPWLKTLEMEPGVSYRAGGSVYGEDDKQAWATAFGIDPNGMEFKFGGDPPNGVPFPNNAKVFFTYDASSSGQVSLPCPWKLDSAGKVVYPGSYLTDRYDVLDLSPGASLKPEDQLALRRALGERISDAEAKAFLARREQELAEEAKAASVKASGATLTPHAHDALAAAGLDLQAGKTYPVWRIEEAVARATGSHVVSDGLLYASAAAVPEGQPRALATLEALCSQPARGFMRSPEWEWGDAGTFLHFRTANRDIWRAAHLPAATTEWLDAQTRPFLPKPEDRGKAFDFSLSIDPEAWTRQFAGLSDLQLLYGARVLHGDPSDPAEAARHAAWTQASEYAQVGLSLLRFLGGLDSAQWRLARAGALRWPEEVTPDQGKLLALALSEKLMRPPAAGAFPRIRISVDASEPKELAPGYINLADAFGIDADGHPLGSMSASLTGPAPKRCHRVTLSASVAEKPGLGDPRLDKHASFLPETLVVHAAGE
jgi:hypothetical protein